MKTGNNVRMENRISPFEKERRLGLIIFGSGAILLGTILLLDVLYPHLINLRFIFPTAILLVGLKWIVQARFMRKHRLQKRYG